MVMRSFVVFTLIGTMDCVVCHSGGILQNLPKFFIYGMKIGGIFFVIYNTGVYGVRITGRPVVAPAGSQAEQSPVVRTDISQNRPLLFAVHRMDLFFE